MVHNSSVREVRMRTQRSWPTGSFKTLQKKRRVFVKVKRNQVATLVDWDPRTATKAFSRIRIVVWGYEAPTDMRELQWLQTLGYQS
jgi:hypothetical protein